MNAYRFRVSMGRLGYSSDWTEIVVVDSDPYAAEQQIRNLFKMVLREPAEMDHRITFINKENLIVLV